MSTHKLNFSGHPVTGFAIAPLVGANLPTDGDGLAATLREILLSIPGREGVLRGEPAEIILPGLSHAAGLLLAEWHGQFGNWPVLRWSRRTDKGFEWPDDAVANLNDLREAARTAR